jgi:hypothetical protein
MPYSSWQDTCALCGESRFWPSRSGYFVCAICTPDPIKALLILARRRPGLVQEVQRWRLDGCSIEEA